MAAGPAKLPLNLETDVAAFILGLHLGDDSVTVVFKHVMLFPESTFKGIADAVPLDTDTVRRSLCSLHTVGVVEETTASSGRVTYKANAQNAIHLLRLSTDYRELLIRKFGPLAGQIVESVAGDGVFTLTDCIERVGADGTVSQEDVQAMLNTLIENRYLILHHEMASTARASAAPSSSNSRKRKATEDVVVDDGSGAAKRRPDANRDAMAGADEGSGDTTYYKFNCELLAVMISRQQATDAIRLSVAGTKLSTLGCAILEAVVEIDSVDSNGWRMLTKEVAAREISGFLLTRGTYPNPDELSIANIEATLGDMEMMSPCPVRRMTAGWAVSLQILLDHHRFLTLVSILNKRYSDKAGRLLRILQKYKQVEEKQISKVALMEQKSVRALLYRMLDDDIVTLTEVPRTSDLAANKTFFLWSFDFPRAVEVVRRMSLRFFLNALQRHKHEAEANADWLAVEEGDETYQLLNEDERAYLKKVEQVMSTLHAAIVTLADTAFLLSGTHVPCFPLPSQFKR